MESHKYIIIITIAIIIIMFIAIVNLQGDKRHFPFN